MLRTARASARQHLRAEEGVGENGVGGVAVAQGDEGEAVDAYNMARRKHDVVHAAHVEGSGCGNAAREGPAAGYADRMPRGNKHRRCFCRITKAIICDVEKAASVDTRHITCVALQCDHGDDGIIIHAHHVNHARSSPHAHARPQELDFRVCSILELDERVLRETASVTVHEPDHA